VANAGSCKLLGTDEPDGCKQGFPFPQPKSGAEAIWNHKLKWRGEAVVRFNNQFIAQPDGSYQQTKILEKVKFYYASAKNPVDAEERRGRVPALPVADPVAAAPGRHLHPASGQGRARRQRPRRLALHAGAQAPAPRADGAVRQSLRGHRRQPVLRPGRTCSTALDRYNWKLVGKKELYLPYNSNRIAGNTVKFRDLIRPRHLNQDCRRYELHRYWVVEAAVKPSANHTFKLRRFYIDEDSLERRGGGLLRQQGPALQVPGRPPGHYAERAGRHHRAGSDLRPGIGPLHRHCRLQRRPALRPGGDAVGRRVHAGCGGRS